MPVTLTAEATRADGRPSLAFVAVRVANTEPVARRVTVSNRLAGTVLPPRRHGRPARGWSPDGYEGVVDAGATVGLGYACELTDAEAPLPDAPAGLTGVTVPPTESDALAHALAELGDARPPWDALGRGDSPGDGGRPPVDGDRVNETRGETDRDDSDEGDASESADDSAPAQQTTPELDESLPTDLERFLDAIGTRVTAAETLATGDLTTATDALATLGCSPEALADLLTADRAVLAALAIRVDALCERADAVSVPTDAMETLAAAGDDGGGS